MLKITKEKLNRVTDRIESFIARHEILSVLAAVVVCAVILSVPLLQAVPLHTSNDELGAIVGAAKLAGLDWSYVIRRCGYYGFGYYSLFFPLFRAGLSPVVIYRVILVVTRIVRACVIIPTAYYIGKHYCKLSSSLELLLAAMVCVFPLHANDETNIINDIVVEAVFWIVLLFMCKIIEHEKERGKCVCFWAGYLLTCFYIMLLHTRALLPVIASGMVLTGALIYKKSKAVFGIVGLLPIYMVAKKVISAYQISVWNASGGSLVNASVSFDGSIRIFDFTTWKIWLCMAVGHIGTQTMLTGGMFLLALFLVVRYFYRLIRFGESEELIFNALLMVPLLCMGGAVFAFAFSGWVAGMQSTWFTASYGNDNSYKALCYVRYWNIFAMPVLLCSIRLWGRGHGLLDLKPLGIAAIFLAAEFALLVVPIIQRHGAAASFLYTFLGKENEVVEDNFYYKCMMVTVFFVVIGAILAKYIDSRYALCALIIFLAIGYRNVELYYNRDVREKISSLADASYCAKCSMENHGIELGTVYAIDERAADSNWLLYSVLQFYFYDCTIIDEYPQVVGDNDIIITTERNIQLEKKFRGLNRYELDENEIWYTRLE